MRFARSAEHVARPTHSPLSTGERRAIVADSAGAAPSAGVDDRWARKWEESGAEMRAIFPRTRGVLISVAGPALAAAAAWVTNPSAGHSRREQLRPNMAEMAAISRVFHESIASVCDHYGGREPPPSRMHKGAAAPPPVPANFQQLSPSTLRARLRRLETASVTQSSRIWFGRVDSKGNILVFFEALRQGNRRFFKCNFLWLGQSLIKGSLSTRPNTSEYRSPNL